MKYTMLTAAALFAITFPLLQLIPPGLPKNPPLSEERTIEAKLRVPSHVSAIFNRACKNCHSNETAWPWYSRVAPASWAMAHDVGSARKAMNLSEWTSNASAAIGTLTAACADVQSGRMPKQPYRLLHPESRLSRGDVKVFCDWTRVEVARLRQERGREKQQAARSKEQ
jgi:hypothetical protein